MAADNFEFLVIGAGRGGTSLLAGLLDFHDQLDVGFEQYSEAYLAGTALAAVKSRDIFETRVLAFLRGCQEEAARVPDQMYGNKITTEHLFGLEDHNVANPDAKIDVLDVFFNRHMRGILEAMAWGLPIVTAPVFGIREQVREEVNGIFYEPGNVAALAAEITRLVADDTLHARLAGNAAPALDALTDFDVTVERYGRIFVEAAAP